MSWAKHAFVVVQSSLKEYLHGCLFVARSGKPQRSRRESWFDAYQRHFNDRLGIDWTESPVQPQLIEEINLARNDVQHTGKGIWNGPVQGCQTLGAISEGHLRRCKFH
jgi:hypothetical protein